MVALDHYDPETIRIPVREQLTTHQSSLVCNFTNPEDRSLQAKLVSALPQPVGKVCKVHWRLSAIRFNSYRRTKPVRPIQQEQDRCLSNVAPGSGSFSPFGSFVISGVAFLDRTNISIAGLQISSEYGLGNQRLGWIFSAFLIGYAGFQLPAGWLAVRFGPRRVLTLGVMWWGVTTGLTALLPSRISHAVMLLVAVRFALGAGEAVVYPAANQFVARWVPMKERGLINGLIFAGVGAGSGLTPPLLNWLITHHGWRAAFWFSAVVGLVVGAVWWFAARDTPEEHSRVSAAGTARDPRGCMSFRSLRLRLLLQMALTAKAATTHISWRAIFHRRDLPALMVGYFSFGYIAWILLQLVLPLHGPGAWLRSQVERTLLPCFPFSR